MQQMTAVEADQISGGLQLVSPETLGCAVGAAYGAEITLGNPWGGAIGCLIGAAVANGGEGSNYTGYGIGVTPLG
jgi:hypothetical protein